MPDDVKEDVAEQNSGVLDLVGNSATDLLTGIPAPIKKSFFKAVGQLCTAAVDVPVSYLEGKAAETRAETDARLEIIKTGANQIAEQMDVSPAYAQAAVEKYGQKIIKERINLDSIVHVASEELKSPDHEISSDETAIIGDDWLNAFEMEACQKSSDEMKMLFGKILAGEVRNPNSFSIRTLRLLSQLDNNAATLFHKLCGYVLVKC